MKQLLFIPALFLFEMAFSQSDTIFLRNKEKLPVKIYEISEYEIRYRRADMEESPLFVSSIENVFKIKYKNGTSQVYIPDELTIPYDVKEIVQQKEAFKFHVFDLPAGKISFGYERVMRPGVNADFKVGIFNSNLYSSFNSSYDGGLYNPYKARFGGGTFIKGGLKLLMGNNTHSKGMKYAHLLSGGYLRFDVYVSYIQYHGINYYIPDPNYVPPPNNYYNYNYAAGLIQKSTDATNYNYGFLICLGSQHVLANILTLDYYAGLGFNGSSYSFSQSDFGKNGTVAYNNGYGISYGNYYNPQSANVLAAQRFSNFMAATIGFNIGFVYKRKAAIK